MQIKNTELVKWIALILMVGDHINKYLLNNAMPFLYNAGRVAMPLFFFVLAYNLSRPDSLKNNIYIRVSHRLFIFGVISTPAYILLGGVIDGWWPLNILFTLLSLSVTCYLLEQGQGREMFYAFLFFALSGSVVEFWWPAIAMGVCFWLYHRNGENIFLFLSLIFCSTLALINHNFYALLAVPVLILAGNMSLVVHRMKWLFYVFYPLHLYLILVFRTYLTSKGYLFFTW
ncbi:conjugal transfer protein TraX [Serratia sp. S1B]|nr:conjugal transfer protein TraX [Serratia sp. S1B]